MTSILEKDWMTRLYTSIGGFLKKLKYRVNQVVQDRQDNFEGQERYLRSLSRAVNNCTSRNQRRTRH